MNAQDLMTKAQRALSSAHTLLDAGDSDGACNRAYYAMFDAARAALIASDAPVPPEIAKTHSGLISAFSLHLVKTDLFPKELGRAFNKVEDLRLVADYKGDPIEHEDAIWTVQQATANVNYSYDANGALLNDGLRHYAYDAEGRLAATSLGWATTTGAGATADDSITKYAHNAAAQRVFKTAPLFAQTNPDPTAPQSVIDSFTQFLESLWSPSTNPDGSTVQKSGLAFAYDEDGTLIADTLTGGASTTWAQSARYIHLPTATGPMPIAAIYGTKHYAIQSDHLNTPRRLVQSDGQVAWQWPYSAFGDEKPTIAKTRFANTDLAQNFGATTVPAVTFNLRYPGQYFDAESNLHYNYHRSYSATLGRYTQADPIGLDGGWNRFGYVGGNALSFTDPLGLDYWMEGSVKGEGGYPYHQSICVGKHSGGRLCISFGVAEDNCYQDCKGEVYEDTSTAGPLVPGRFRSTSAAQDAEIRAYFRSLIGKTGRYYLIGNNCTDFSNRVYWTLENRYFPKGATPF